MLIQVEEYTLPLSRTPKLLRAVVEDVPESWLDSRHAADVVSPRETVAHILLCEAEESWITRIRFLLEPDMVYVPGPYAGMSDAALAGAKSVAEMLDEFTTAREQNLQELKGMQLTTDDMAKSLTEDGFGTQTVENVLSTWVAHDLYHLGQIFKSYSSLYIDKIGPYQQFLNLPNFN